MASLVQGCTGISFQEMYLVSACVWTEKASNTIHFWCLIDWLSGAHAALAAWSLHL